MRASLKVIYLLSCIGLLVSSCSSNDEAEKEQEMEQATLDGDYRGSWTSVTETTSFTNVPVSARFQFASNSDSRLLGEFFISTNFTSCCESGANDGTLVMEVSGNTITSFQYNDIIPSCSGTFNGTGTITATGSLSIEFTGSDCDGNHVGTITLSKV